MNWLKWHYGTVTDPKFGIIARKVGQPRAIVIAVWAALLETACNGVTRGNVTSFNPEEIGFALDLEPEIVMAVFNAIMARGMVKDGHIAAWDKRQTSDYSGERVKRFREKQKAAKRDVTDVTRYIVTETQIEEKEEIEEKERIEGEGARAPTPPAVDLLDIPPELDKRKATHLPADWALSDEWRDVAEAKRAEHGLPPVSLMLEAEKFRNYWHAKSGKDGTKRDWRATWINWALKADAPRGTNVQSPQHRNGFAELIAKGGV
jgi:hypothetical protein